MGERGGSRETHCSKNAKGPLHALGSQPSHLPPPLPRPAFPPSLFPPSHHPPLSPSLPPPAMPTCRRKRVLLTEPSPALLDALKNDPGREVFYLAETGEIFDTYECAYRPPPPTLFHPCNPRTVPGPMPHGCPSTASNSSNARLLERVVSTISRHWRASDKKPVPCTRGSRTSSSLLSSKQFSGVGCPPVCFTCLID